MPTKKDLRQAGLLLGKPLAQLGHGWFGNTYGMSVTADQVLPRDYHAPHERGASLSSSCTTGRTRVPGRSWEMEDVVVMGAASGAGYKTDRSRRHRGQQHPQHFRRTSSQRDIRSCVSRKRQAGGTAIPPSRRTRRCARPAGYPPPASDRRCASLDADQCSSSRLGSATGLP